MAKLRLQPDIRTPRGIEYMVGYTFETAEFSFQTDTTENEPFVFSHKVLCSRAKHVVLSVMV